MRITPGERIGPYEVVALIGAGGMVDTSAASSAPPLTVVVNWTAGLKK